MQSSQKTSGGGNVLSALMNAGSDETDGLDLVAVETKAMGVLAIIGIHADSFFSASNSKGQRYDPEQSERPKST